jgi:hypothetical protein
MMMMMMKLCNGYRHLAASNLMMTAADLMIDDSSRIATANQLRQPATTAAAVNQGKHCQCHCSELLAVLTLQGDCKQQPMGHRHWHLTGMASYNYSRSGNTSTAARTVEASTNCTPAHILTHACLAEIGALPQDL